MNRGRRADEIVGRCRERLDRGERVDPEEVIREHPDLAAVLRPRLAALALLASSSRGPSTAAATVGPYRVLRELGRGAQGTVYLAEDTRLPRRVALKVFSPGLLPSARFLGRVRREAETASRLDHPGICTVYDAAIDSDTPYIAMRHVDGRSLQEWIEEARARAKSRATTTGVELPASSDSTPPQGVMRVVALVERAARALHAAHEAGVVHRDVKPGNILVTREGEPVLVDFGLAQEDEGGKTLTATGALVGTPAYMSPEQLLGGEVRLDARTDVYSLGVTLYECLTLGLPFEGPTREALYRQILSSSADSPRRANPRVPRDLEVVIETAMAKSREGRYATAVDFAEDLRRLRMHEPIRARATPAWVRLARLARRHPASSTAVVATFVLLATGLAITTHFLGRSVEEQRRTAAALEDKTRSSEHARSLALSGASALAIPVDGVRALLLAREAVRAEPSAAAFNQLRKAIYHSLERAEMTGQGGPMLDVAVTAKGDRVATASQDHTASIWDMSGRRLAVLAGHAAIVRSVAFSPAGDLVVTASDDWTARVWDITGRLLAVLQGHAAPVTRAVFSAQGDRVVTASEDATARVWDLAGVPIAVLSGHTKPVNFAEFSPSGDQVVTASDDATTRVWDSAGKPLAVLSGHTSPIHESRFSAQGDRVVTASRDGTARVWDLAGTQIAVLRPVIGDVLGAAFSPQGDRVVTASSDLTARLWDLDGRESAPPMRHNETLVSAEFSRAGDRIVTASYDRAARVWDTSGRLLATMRGHDAWLAKAAFIARGDRVVTASFDGTARIWDVAERELAVVAGHTAPVWSAKYSPDGRRIVTASDDKTARVWDLEANELAVLRGHNERITTAAFSRHGDFIVTASVDKSARVWDVHGKELAVLEGHRGGVRGAAFSPHDDRIVTACFDGCARVFDAAGKLLATLDAHAAKVEMGAFSPDGDRLVTTYTDGAARVWDLASEKEIALLRGHGDSAMSAAWSPRGDRIVTGSRDRTARIWTPSGEQVVVLEGHDNVVLTAVFSPDGELILTASLDGTARLWDLEGNELAVIEGSGAGFTGASFSPKGDKIVTSSIDGTARTWLVRNDDVLALADQRITRDFTLRERELYADILGPDNADEIAAFRVVDGLQHDAVLVAEMVDRLDADASLSPGVRAATRRLLAQRTDDPRAILAAAWEVVKAPGRSAGEYGLALRRLEAAASLAPGDGAVTNSLGVAQYRVGRFVAALETLERSAAINSKTRPLGTVDDVAFLAMCHHRLGHADEARQCLTRLHAMAKPANGTAAAALVAEAEAACAK